MKWKHTKKELIQNEMDLHKKRNGTHQKELIQNEMELINEKELLKMKWNTTKELKMKWNS